jgi:hypothetical protein
MGDEMNATLERMRNELIDGMTRYMLLSDEKDADDDDQDFDAGYQQEHVDHCRGIVDRYFAELGGMIGNGGAPNEAILGAVQRAVVALNELNVDTNYCLIETDQREQLCEIIIAAARDAGLATGDDDITEEWRDW